MSRLKLQWYNLTQKKGEDLRLKIPLCDVYSSVLDRAFPAMKHIGWRLDTEGTCYTYFKGVNPSEFDQLDSFLQLLQSLMLLTITPRLKTNFSNELDEAYALDFNFKPDVKELEYTEVGSLEHEAKDNQDGQAAKELAAKMSHIICSHPTLSRVDLIMAIPPRPSKRYHLPSVIVGCLRENWPAKVRAIISKKEHEKLRDLEFERKLQELDDVFTLNEDVRDCSILIIDDLYQSGATCWSIARFLKAQGAREVFALVCVKSWSDKDNL